MALEQRLQLKLAQRLVMTPSLQQAIKLLLLSRVELEQSLSNEILENPMLEVEADEEQGSEDVAVETTAEDGENAAENSLPESDSILPSPEESYADIDVEAFFSDYLGGSVLEGPSMAVPEDRKSPIENMLPASSGLYEHLLWQLHLTDCSKGVLEAGEFVIGNLDENGFLHASDDEIMTAIGCDRALVQETLEIVRSLDPPGIAARSLQECLELQIGFLILGAESEDERALLDRARMLVTQHWESFLHQRWEEIAQALQVDLDILREVVGIIRRLETKPGRKYHSEDNFFVEPDVFVRKVEGEYHVFLNDDGLPKLRINRRYMRMLEGNGLDSQAAGYLRGKMRDAIWLMKSIDQRQRTVFKVAQSIVSFQTDFFDYGLEYLRPMVLRQVAEDIGMHESTISRVVTNKYMATPRGLYPMKFFFHSGVDSARGENVSSLVVKDHIKRAIEQEDPKHPLSDSKIMKILQRDGIRLARRTVAKYREEMGIASSDKRRRAL